MNDNTNRSLWPAGNAIHNLCVNNAKKTVEAMEAGERIRRLREAKHLTLAALAQLTGGRLTGSRIGNYEQGSRTLDIRSARILALPLNAHPAYLVGLLSEEEHRFLKALGNPHSPDRPFAIPMPAPAVRTKAPPSRK